VNNSLHSDAQTGVDTQSVNYKCSATLTVDTTLYSEAEALQCVRSGSHQ